MTASGVPCELLAWDSEFFGFTIARVTAERLDEETMAAILAWCDEERVRCAYFLAPADHRPTIRLAERNGFELVDVRVELGVSLAGVEPRGFERGQRLAVPDDLDALRSVARGSFEQTRFFFDPGFPRERSKAMYETWLARAVNGELDAAVLIDQHDSAPVAFQISQRDHQTAVGRLVLGAVDPEFRDRGVGGRLIGSVLSLFAREGLEKATMYTQARNVGSLRFHGRLGFEPTRVDLQYHRWFDRP